MDIILQKMTQNDRQEVLAMMREFYTSDAVLSNGSEEIYNADIDACLHSPFAKGYVFFDGEKCVGYGMLAFCFSTEYGKKCVWVEDLYLKPEYRRKGIGGKFLNFVNDEYPDCIKKLEVESENETAKKLYFKCGFKVLPYIEMIKK